MFQPGLYATTNLVAHPENAGISNRINDRGSIAVAGEDAGVGQRLEMTRDIGLA